MVYIYYILFIHSSHDVFQSFHPTTLLQIMSCIANSWLCENFLRIEGGIVSSKGLQLLNFTVYWFTFPHIPLIHAILLFSNFCQTSRIRMLSQCCFDLHFTSYEWVWPTPHILNIMPFSLVIPFPRKCVSSSFLFFLQSCPLCYSNFGCHMVISHFN